MITVAARKKYTDAIWPTDTVDWWRNFF